MDCAVAAKELDGKDTAPLPSARQLCPCVGGKGMEGVVDKVCAGNGLCKAPGAGQGGGCSSRRNPHILFPQNPGEPGDGIGPEPRRERRAGSGGEIAQSHKPGPAQGGRPILPQAQRPHR